MLHGSVGGAVCAFVPLCPTVRDAAGSAVDHAVGGLASSVVDDVFGVLASGIDEAARTSLDGLAALLGPDPAVGSSWFGRDVAAMTDVGGLLELPLLMLATIGAVVRQDTARLLRIWLVALPASILFTVLAVPLVHVALGATGELASVLTRQAQTPSQVRGMVDTLAPPLATIGGGVLAVVVGLALLFATLVLSLELVVRNSAIYLVVLFLPMVFAAAVWPPMLVAVKRALEVLAALILAKFVITATLVLGASMLTAGAGISTDLSGLAVLMLAAFAPMAVLRLMPLIEGAAIGHLEGRARQPVQAARRGARSARASVLPVASLLGLNEGPVAGDAVGAGAAGAAGGAFGAAGFAGAGAAAGAARGAVDALDGVTAPSGGAGAGAPGGTPPGGTAPPGGTGPDAGGPAAGGPAAGGPAAGTPAGDTGPDGGGGGAGGLLGGVGAPDAAAGFDAVAGADAEGTGPMVTGGEGRDDRFPWGEHWPPLADGIPSSPSGAGWVDRSPVGPDAADDAGSGL